MSSSLPPPLLDEAVAQRRRELGRRLRERRQASGLSQEGLAEASGVERKLVSRAETGTHAITLDSLIQIAHGLGLSESDLLAE